MKRNCLSRARNQKLVGDPFLNEFTISNPATAKRKREEDKAKIDSTNKNISNYFTKGAAGAVPKVKVIQKTAITYIN